MQKSISPSAIMYSTDDDCVASQPSTTDETAALTYASNCGRPGCIAVFVYSGKTDWPTVNRLIDEHYPVCTGGIRGPAFSYPLSNTCSTPEMPSPPQLAPESLGSGDNHHDNFIIAGHSKQTRRKSKRNRNEGERKEYLENDEYTNNIRPKSVKCRGCGGVICLDNRYRYYPGLWDRHRDICQGILRLENEKLAMGENCITSSDPEQAASALGVSDEYWEGDSDEEEDEDGIMKFSSKLMLADGSKRRVCVCITTAQKEGRGNRRTVLRHDEENSGARM